MRKLYFAVKLQLQLFFIKKVGGGMGVGVVILQKKAEKSKGSYF